MTADDAEPLGLSDDAFEGLLGWLQASPEAWGLEELPESEVRPIRRLLWTSFLGVTSGSDPVIWASELQAQREAYEELKERHQKEGDVRKHNPNICNPLSRHADNPFLKLQANEDLLQEIWKDVERTFPEKDMFLQEDSRRCIQQVLFHWCKACNPAADASESYRQGMNELAAICFFVVRHGEYVGDDSGGLAALLCGEAHREADTFALLSALLERGGLREMFAVVRAIPAAKAKPGPDIGSVSGRSPLQERAAPPSRPQSAVLARCDHIFNTVLKKVDSSLHSCLKDQHIEPQLFVMRWLRLLFCREFHIDETVVLWTCIFADAASATGQAVLPEAYTRTNGPGGEGVAVAEAASQALPLVDYFALAMIEFLRSQLLTSDESECLQMLMRYPPVDNVLTLVGMAKRLRDGKPLVNESASARPEAPLAAAVRSSPEPPGGGEKASVPSIPPGDSTVATSARSNDPLGARSLPGPLSAVAGQSATQVAAGAQVLVKSLFDAGRQAVEGLGAASDASQAKGPPTNPLAGPLGGTNGTTNGPTKTAAPVAVPSTSAFEPVPRIASTTAAEGSSTRPSDGAQQDLQQDTAAPVFSATAQQITDLQLRVKSLEQEKASLVEKAKQYVATKTDELRARIVELEEQVANAQEAAPARSGGAEEELRARIVELEEEVASVHEAAMANKPAAQEAAMLVEKLRGDLAAAEAREAAAVAATQEEQQQRERAEAEMEALRGSAKAAKEEAVALQARVLELEAQVSAALAKELERKPAAAEAEVVQSSTDAAEQAAESSAEAAEKAADETT